jgi:hypothetical protein
MIEWVLKNKEWVFSGLGITVLGILFFGFRFLWKKLLLINKPPFDKSKYKPKPLPVQIRNNIDSCPPYQRKAKIESYLGLSVQWRTTLQHIDDRAEGVVGLMMLDRGNYPWIYCTVNTKEYPELKVAGKGTRMWVAGVLDGIDTAGGQYSLSVEKIIIMN